MFTISAYVAIGNTDNKLTQQDWSDFIREVRQLIEDQTVQIHGEWHSLPDKPWQNACWSFDIMPSDVSLTQTHLAALATKYRQDTIAWSITTTFFIEAKPVQID